MAKTAQYFDCGINLAREVLNGKWKISLIYVIAEGTKRPSDIHRQISSGTKRVLNLQLKELETHGIVTKKIYHQLPPKVEYSLTPLGETLMPIINAISQWGDKNRLFLAQVINPEEQLV